MGLFDKFTDEMEAYALLEARRADMGERLACMVIAHQKIEAEFNAKMDEMNGLDPARRMDTSKDWFTIGHAETLSETAFRAAKEHGWMDELQTHYLTFNDGSED